MGLELKDQLLELVKAFLLGAGLGLGYDLLRPPRRRLGRVIGTLLDVFFSVLAAAACFVGAMGAGTGRLGVWELSASLLGFLLYLYALSPMILPLFSAGYDFLRGIMAWCKKISVYCQFFAKKIFQNVRKCFIVKR